VTDTTPVYNLPFPEGTDAPDGPTQIENLALAVEAVLARMDTTYVQRVYTATGVTVWNKPTGIKGVIVELQGGGGGSGGCATTAANQTSGSGGGKGGAYARFWVPAASLAATENVTVGTGGTAAAAGNNSGGDGAATSFGAFGSAPGGEGGAGGGAAASSGASTSQNGGDAAQTFSGTATGVLFVPGADGGVGIRINNSACSIPGTGGGSHLGASRAIGQITSGQIPGTAGALYGGGAAGPANMLAAGNAQQAGAAGAQGVAVVWEIY
jgi:hypothetical protein